jgi:predicted transcriptional regulator
MSRERLSARDLSSLLKIELNTSSTRLINLHRQRLVTRRERTIAEGGREFVYAGLISPVRAGEGASV